MIQRENDLPEGTDSIIQGAMDTDTSDVTGERETRSSRSSPARRSSAGSGSGSGAGTALMEKVRSGGEKLSGQAADKARDFVGQGMERSAEAISNVAKLVGDTAPGLEERLGPEYADYARRAAETLEGAANRLAEKDPDELIDDTRNFIRKSPGVALAGAAIVGFALARLVKSGLSMGDEDGDDDDRDRRARSPRKRS
jgi:hypothetical protein